MISQIKPEREPFEKSLQHCFQNLKQRSVSGAITGFATRLGILLILRVVPLGATCGLLVLVL